MVEKHFIDNIIESAVQRIQDEISGLIGTSFMLTDNRTEIVPREDFLNLCSGTQLFTRIKISGDISCNGSLIIDIKDAIRLGGALIMLPPDEVDERVEKESYDEETEDSFGEIANIIAGIYTGSFEKEYDTPCRFERQEQHLVEGSSAGDQVSQLIEDGQLYCLTSKLTLGSDRLGNLTLVLPAEPFDLVEASAIAEPSPNPETDISAGASDEDDSSGVFNEATPAADNLLADMGKASQVSSAGRSTFSAAQGRRNDIDSLLELCRASLQQEIGEIVGVEVTLGEMKNQVVSKEYFFRNELPGKQVAASLEATGDCKDRCYLSVGLKDAIRIGSTLLMLPSSELEAAVAEETFTTDVEDAYDEIVGVICSVYSKIFTDQDSLSLELEALDIDRIVPMKVDIAGESPIVNQNYYLNRFAIGLDGRQTGHLRMLFPSDLLGLGSLQPDEMIESSIVPEDRNQVDAPPDMQASRKVSVDEIDAGGSEEEKTGQLLIISDADPEATRIHDILSTQGISAVTLNFRDNVNDYLPGTFKAVLLVMKDVDEQSLGMAIKINTSCSLPLIAAGASWTRSKVFKAVKYGVTDILLAPASAEDIDHKISPYLASLAA